MKIAIMISSLRFGGAEVQTVELANNLYERGYEILLISMFDDMAIRDRVVPGVEFVTLGKRSYLDFKLLHNIIRLLSDYKPQVLVMVNSYPALYGYAASFFTGSSFKKICIQHTTLYTGLADWVQNLYYMHIINRMDRVVFVSSNQKLHWVKKYRIKPEKSVVIYNGINLDRFEGFETDTSALRAQLDFLPSDIVIGINANLRPEKKHEDMVDALEILLKQGYPVKLLFIGDGVRRNFIENYIEEKGLKDKVVITGFVQDVRAYLSCVDISALTSVAVETLSIAIIESMALGKPVVLSDIGGARELVDQGENGIVYEAGKVDQLVNAIKQIIDGRLFGDMGRKSREKANVLFSKDKMVDKYIEILQE